MVAKVAVFASLAKTLRSNIRSMAVLIPDLKAGCKSKGGIPIYRISGENNLFSISTMEENRIVSLEGKERERDSFSMLVLLHTSSMLLV